MQKNHIDINLTLIKVEMKRHFRILLTQIDRISARLSVSATRIECCVICASQYFFDESCWLIFFQKAWRRDSMLACTVIFFSAMDEEEILGKT